MTTKIIAPTFIAFLLFLSANVQAAVNCRSATAAAQGSQAGYQRDTQAAEQIAQKERNASDILGKCVGAITAVNTVPQFPSLSSIFDQIKNQICRIASDQINNSANAVNSQINGAMSGITGQSNNTGIGQITAPTAQVNVSSQPSAQASSSAFWSNIWR